MYKIKQNIPVPTVKRGRKPKDIDDYEIPIHKMKVRDFIQVKEEFTNKNASKWRSKIIYMRKKLTKAQSKKMMFTVKEYKGQIGIWRIS